MEMLLKSFYEIPVAEYMFKGHPKVNVDHEEEKVRQWVLKELTETYGYPKDWFGIGNLIDIEVPVQMGTDVKFADIAIFTKIGDRRKPFIFVETKARSKKDGIAQLHSYLAATITANIGLWTNGDEIQCFRKNVDPTDIVPHPDIPEYKIKQLLSLDKGRLIKIVIPSKVLGERTGILAPIPDFEAKLFRCHSILRDEENLHPDEALDEMCKLLYVKIYDEIHTKSEEDFAFQTYIYGNPEQLGASIKTLYEDITEKEKEILQQHGKYDRGRAAYSEPLRIKDSTIWQIVEALQSYSITETSFDSRGRAFEKFLGTTFRGALGQYFTPEPVVRLMIGILDPIESDLIVDPACGSARFLTAAIRHVKEKRISKLFGEVDGKKVYEDFVRGNLHGIEISKRLVRVAMADMMLYDDAHTNIRCTDGLDDFKNYIDVSPEIYSIAVTNPPFGSIIKDELTLSRFALSQGRRSQHKEILFLNRCFELVKPGGKIGIVLPDGLLSNSNRNDKTVRKWYRSQGQIVATVALPFHTFVPFGANAKTHVVFFRKWLPTDDKGKAYDIYAAEVQDVGYDSAGNTCGEGDIAEAIADFHSTRGWSA